MICLEKNKIMIYKKAWTFFYESDNILFEEF